MHVYDLETVKIVPVDYCLAPLVEALNNAGAFTKACCCGHGVGPGTILLHDGTDIRLPKCRTMGESLVPPELRQELIGAVEAATEVSEL